jgi:uncharacterized protein (TIGR02466 family)
MNIYEHAIFANFVYTIELENIDNGTLENFVANLAKTTSSKNRSNSGGWQSDVLSPEAGEITFLLDRCLDVCQEVSNIWKLSKQIIAKNYWININRKNNFNYPHFHPRSLFSGVYYVNAAADSGNLVIKRPDIQEHYVDNFNSIYTQKNFCITPKTGLFVVFPSYLCHFVEQNLSEEPRISIAINFDGVPYGR